MNNRLTEKLNETMKNKKKLFCAYLTLGFPSLSVTEATISTLERSGTDIIELGFPFSDPLADGPIIQFASTQAIRRGIRLQDAFRLVRKLRRKGIQIPILFFSYLNPIMHYGISRAIRQLRQSGFDGLIIPDLPPEEGRMWEPWFKRYELSLVYFIAPTTGSGRMKEIIRRSSGFIYYVSLRGVTGMRNSVPDDLIQNLKTIKKMTQKPVLVGFGVSSPQQARKIARAADGIIVGSAIVDQLRRGRKAIGGIGTFASRLVRSLEQKE